MPSIQDDAFKIAKLMYERKHTGANYVTVSDLKKMAQLSADDFEAADSFLLESHYCDGTMGGDAGHRVLKAAGMTFVNANLLNATNSRKIETPLSKKEYMTDIFISHSSKDAKIAEALITLLRGALNIPARRIRCTSVEGYRLPVGVSTDDQLRLELRESKLFIALLTPTSLRSQYVLFELGARWGASLPMVPLLAAGAKPDILPDPLRRLNVLSCSVPTQLHQLVQNIAEVFDVEPESPAVYQKCVDDLIQKSEGVEEAQQTDYKPRGYGNKY